jgi:hypothetical protein
MISPWMPFYSVLLKTMSVIDCQGNDKRRMCGSWPRSLLNLKLRNLCRTLYVGTIRSTIAEATTWRNYDDATSSRLESVNQAHA